MVGGTQGGRGHGKREVAGGELREGRAGGPRPHEALGGGAVTLSWETTRMTPN